MIKSILIGPTTFAVCYLFTAIVVMDINSAHWGMGVGVLFAFASIIFGLLAVKIFINNKIK